MSHYAVADEPDRVETAQQTQVLESAHRELTAVLDEAQGRLGESDRLEVHIANSPAALTLLPFPGTSARVGLSLYGLSPLEDRDSQDLGLAPVMRLVSQVVNLKDVPGGHGASYGLTFTAQNDTRFCSGPGWLWGRNRTLGIEPGRGQHPRHPISRRRTDRDGSDDRRCRCR